MELKQGSSKYLTMLTGDYGQPVRATIYEDGHVVIEQGKRTVYTDGWRKSKIVRNAFLPRWVENAINNGKAVLVQDITATKGDRGWFVTIRGKEVEKTKTYEEKERMCHYTGGEWYALTMRETWRENYVVFGDERDYAGVSDRHSEDLYGITKDEKEAWDLANPKPEGFEEYYEDYLDGQDYVDVTDNSDITEVVVSEYKKYQPHTRGYWWNLKCKDTGSSFELSWNKEACADCWAVKHVKVGETRKKVISLTEVSRRTETYTSKYESDDGMRMCYDTEHVTWVTYDVVCEDCSKYRYTSCKTPKEGLVK